MRTQDRPAHIECEKGEIAKTVLMPGDPLRAKYIAENYLENAKLINDIRNMFGYTGTYKGKEITVMGSGMGMPSMGIYAYELYHFYDVDNIIRIGSCGNPLDPETKIMDIVIADSAYSEANFAYQLYRDETHYIENKNELTSKIINKANELGIKNRVGTIMTTEVFDFYIQNVDEYLKTIPTEKYNIVAAEMECYALFHVAKLCGKNAACLATVVDSHFVEYFISMEDREQNLDTMIKLALDAVV